MKKLISLSLMLLLLGASYKVWAEETEPVSAAPTVPPASTNEEIAAPAAAGEQLTVPAPVEEKAAPAEAPAVAPSTAAIATDSTAKAAEPVKAEAASAADNLEFVSGQVASVDEASKTITVKLYGETEDKTSEKMLSVKLDESTDITDGEKDRELKSLTAGTEVDVEYDPAANKATYIFVY